MLQSYLCYNQLSRDTCSWIVGHSLSLASAEKDSTDCFAWVYKLQTPKPEHDCKIKTDGFFDLPIYTLVGQVMISLMVKKQ